MDKADSLEREEKYSYTAFRQCKKNLKLPRKTGNIICQ